MFTALLAACTLALLPQEPAACDTCKDRGVITCRMCATRSCRSESPTLFCSVEGACSECGGARLVECKFCDHPPEVDPRLRRDALAAWRATLAPFEEYMNAHDLVHLESAHFVLSSDVKRTDHKSASSQHDAAHLQLDRLERLFTEFSTDAGAKDERFTGKTRVLVWASEKAQERASSKYTLERSTTQAKLLGKQPVVSLCYGKGRIRGDEDLHRALVHQVAHCLLSNLDDGVWLGNRKGGWLDEGTAFVYERRSFGDVRSWCYVTDEELKKLKFGSFEAEVLEHLGEAPDFTTLASLDTVALSPQQRVFAWSYCDYIVRAHPGKLGLVAKFLKQDKPVSEAILNGLGLSLTDFQLAWKAWVTASYSARNKR